jgi:predicted DNA-binding transcriptional regulator AlpA
MTVPASGTRENFSPARLLKVSEAATRLGVSTDDLYRHAKQGMVK